MFERVRNNLALPEFRMPDRASRLVPYLRRMMAPLSPAIARIKAAGNPALEAGKAWYEKREPREKLLLRLLGAVFAVPLAGIGWVLLHAAYRNDVRDLTGAAE